MFDSIFIGTTGLTGYSRGLKVVSNNITNLNTPGFKGGKLQFTDMFYQRQATPGGDANYGLGLNTLGSRLNFEQGEVRQTGNALDLSIGGEGYFVLRKDGTSRFTRAGQFEFDKEGNLMSRASGMRLAGFDSGGQLVDINLNGLRTNAPKATTEVLMSGNLSSSASEFTVDNIKIINPLGGEMIVKAVFKQVGATSPGTWSVTLSGAAGEIAKGEVKFVNGRPAADASSLKFSMTAENGSPFEVTLKLSADATSFSAGANSTLTVTKIDGYGAGLLTNVSFDADGYLVLNYSNGQTAKGARVALARFDSNIGLEQRGNGEFESTDAQVMQMGMAKQGSMGSINGGTIEVSNVDLSEEFSDLIVMQRGYQASSRIVSTANQMIAELFDMKGNR